MPPPATELWLRARVADRSLVLVPLTWPGGGAALVLLRETPAGLCVINVWAFGFGGNGLDITGIRVDEPSETETRIHVDLVGHHRGYYPDPNDREDYVEPSDSPMHRVIATDGRRAWLVDDGTPADSRSPSTAARLTRPTRGATRSPAFAGLTQW